MNKPLILLIYVSGLLTIGSYTEYEQKRPTKITHCGMIGEKCDTVILKKWVFTSWGPQVNKQKYSVKLKK